MACVTHDPASEASSNRVRAYPKRNAGNFAANAACLNFYSFVLVKVIFLRTERLIPSLTRVASLGVWPPNHLLEQLYTLNLCKHHTSKYVYSWNRVGVDEFDRQYINRYRASPMQYGAHSSFVDSWTGVFLSNARGLSCLAMQIQG